MEYNETIKHNLVMSKPLLTVEDTFIVTGRGLFLVPSVSPGLISANTLKDTHYAPVRLIRPDASEEIVEATFSWHHINKQTGSGVFLICNFKTMQKEQVPIGTEVWLLEDDAL